MIDNSALDVNGEHQYDVENVSQYNNLSLLSEIEIKLPYKNIQKITIDIINAEDTELIDVDFCFHFFHCPSVFVTQIPEEGKTFRKSVRHVNWKKEFNVKNFLMEMFGSSAMFVTTTVEKIQFCKIINQISDLAECRIQYKKYIPGPKLTYRGFPNDVFSSWDFEIRYLIDAIFSTGSIGKYRLVRTEEEMKRMISHINTHRRNKTALEEKLRQIYYEILQDGELSGGGFQVQERTTKAITDDDYENIRKVI